MWASSCFCYSRLGLNFFFQINKRTWHLPLYPFVFSDWKTWRMSSDLCFTSINFSFIINFKHVNILFRFLCFNHPLIVSFRFLCFVPIYTKMPFHFRNPNRKLTLLNETLCRQSQTANRSSPPPTATASRKPDLIPFNPPWLKRTARRMFPPMTIAN